MSDERALYLLRGATIDGPRGRLLDAGDLTIPDRVVTAILGPSGTGKSSLLRALSGQTPPEGWAFEGSWRFGERMLPDPALLGAQIAWVAQSKHARIRAIQPDGDAYRRARDALASSAAAVLLDEPTRGVTEAETREIAGLISEQRDRRAVVLVTHDLAFARDVAGEVCLVCAGSIAARGCAATFFGAPPSDLVARFLRDGTCWPPPPEPRLPSHFRWILPGQLAGMGRPGLLDDVDGDLAAISAAGITLLVSLTVQPFPSPLLRPLGIAARHLAIPDMGVPALGPCANLCRDIVRAIEDGGRVAVHCHAGLGRTGTLLAATLVWLGADPDAAITRLRALGKGYVQTRSQHEFVRRFAEIAPRP